MFISRRLKHQRNIIIYINTPTKPQSKAGAVRSTICNGLIWHNPAQKMMTAATGDIVLPNVAPIAPSMPMSTACTGLCAAKAGTTALVNATLGAVPEPEIMAKE